MRWVLGPNFGLIAFTSSAPAPEAPAAAPEAPAATPQLADVEVTAHGIDNEHGAALIGIPAFDPATHQAPAEIRVYAVPESAQLPADADGYINPPEGAPAFAFSALAVPFQAGTVAAIKLPDVPDGNYLLAILLGFES
jgi:hypothetical protein